MIVWGLGRVEKNAKKGSKKCKKYFFVLNKYQDVTHISTSIFQRLLKNIDPKASSSYPYSIPNHYLTYPYSEPS